jgi:hypothetical protein
MFFDPIVTISKPTWRRVEMLVEELAFMQGRGELNGFQLERQTQEFIQGIVYEYVSQFFKESTRSAAELIHQRRKLRERQEYDF